MSQEEEKFDHMQQTFNELLILSENLENNYQKLLADLLISEKQIAEFINNPVNFTQEEWQEIESEKEKMQEMLQLSLSQILDPKKVKKKYSQRKRVKNNWLFVR